MQSKNIKHENVSIDYGSKKILNSASIKLVNMHRYGLIGKNGIGKTSLIKYISNLPYDSILVDQEVKADDKSVYETVLKANKERSTLLSELEANEDYTVKYNEIVEKLKYIQADQSESEVKKLLRGLGFSIEDIDKPTKCFSGGWRMRIALAKALYMKPQILLLDEPTNHLDINSVIWLTSYLSNWNKTLLVISHDVNFLNEICTDIIELENYQIMYYSGNYEQYFSMKEQLYKKHVSDWIKLEKRLKELKTVKERHEVQKKSGLVKPMLPYKVTIDFNYVGKLKNPVIDLKNVCFSYQDKEIFNNLNFVINSDSRIAIVGPNGVGKTTLFNLVISNINPSKGEISKQDNIRIGYYNQHFVDTLPLEKTAIEYFDQYDNEQQIRQVLGKIGLEGKLHKIPIGQLSGGQKARIVLAELQMMEPHILLLDEPTNHLDIETIDALIDSIQKYCGGIVLISHNMNLITKTNCELYVCGDHTITKYKNGYIEYKQQMEDD